MPKLLRRVAVLTATSAVGIALMAPLAAQSARQPGPAAAVSLLDVAPATSTVDRGVPGRERLATFTLLERAPIGPESFSRPPQPLPTPASAPMEATLFFNAAPVAASVAPPQITGDTISGLATWYCCSQGWRGDAVVALPGALGGQYDPPPAARTVTICADRCASLPVVDYCDCFWGTASQRVADLSPEAWALVTDASTGAGVIEVTVHLTE